MIYIKRILWLIGLIPVCLIIALWFMLELFTTPLKMLTHFLVKGRVEDMEIEWFDVLVKPFTDYFYIDLTNEKEE